MSTICVCKHHENQHETNMFGTQCRGTVRHDESVTPCHCEQFVADPEYAGVPDWVTGGRGK